MTTIDYHREIPGLRFDPLWQREVVDGGINFDDWKLREQLVKQFAWAIPNEDALQSLVDLSPLVEIGAGTGYWAFEVQKRGGEIHAYDEYPPNGEIWTPEEEEKTSNSDWHPNKNWYHRGHTTWTEVWQGTPEVMKLYDRHWNLFLCWPPMSDMAAYALGYHRGEYVAYVGESTGGCTADKLFFRILNRVYEHVDAIAIPQWYGLHDSMDIYRRRGR